MTTRTLDDALRWASVGTGFCERALTVLTDEDFAGPSALPGWSRAHVAAHLDRNAAALHDLVAWARTRVETPMYASTAQRDADIEAVATPSARSYRPGCSRSA